MTKLLQKQIGNGAYIQDSENSYAATQLRIIKARAANRRSHLLAISTRKINRLMANAA